MITFLKGTLFKSTPEKIVLETSGIGYEVGISLQTYRQLPLEGKPLFVWIEHIFTSEQQYLCGFIQEEEQACFRLLRNVPGVGIKVALQILSTLPPQDLFNAIQNNDRKTLTQAQGVGPKLASRILAELKNSDFPVMSSVSNAFQEALEALSHLGYNRIQVLQALQKIDPSLSTENLIREALILFSSKG